MIMSVIQRCAVLIATIATTALICSGSEEMRDIFGNWTISPSYGPIAGGTEVELTYSGTGLAQCNRFRLTGYRFATVPNGNPVNTTTCQRKMVIISPPYNRSVGSQPVDVTLCFTVTTALVTNTSPFGRNETNVTSYCSNVGLKFTYKPNPVVNWTSGHLNSILAGGITQTISGSTFEAASRYSLTLYATSSSGAVQLNVQSSCRLCTEVFSTSSSSCLRCETGSVSRLLGFKDDDNSSTLCSLEATSGSFFTTVVAKVAFDEWSTNTSMFVHRNPCVQRLVPEEQEFACNHDLRIEIGVLWPSFDIPVEDIRVDIIAKAFKGSCSDVIVTASKTITCLPPRVKIPVIRYSLLEARTAEVEVTIGGTKTIAGRLIYVIEEPFNVIMIVMIALISFIIVVSTVCGCLTLFHRQLESCCPCCCAPSGSAHKDHYYQPFEGGDATTTTEEQGAAGPGPNGAGGSSKWSLRRKGKSGQYDLQSPQPASNNGESRTKKQSFDMEMFSQKARDDTYY